MSTRYVWLYPEKHEAMHNRHLHLRTAMLSSEDPQLEQKAHAFEEFDVEVPDKEPARDASGYPVMEKGPDGKWYPKIVPSEHPDGLSQAHGIRAACGLTRSSWVNPVLWQQGSGQPRCKECEAQLAGSGKPPVLKPEVL